MAAAFFYGRLLSSPTFLQFGGGTFPRPSRWSNIVFLGRRKKVGRMARSLVWQQAIKAIREARKKKTAQKMKYVGQAFHVLSFVAPNNRRGPPFSCLEGGSKSRPTRKKKAAHFAPRQREGERNARHFCGLGFLFCRCCRARNFICGAFLPHSYEGLFSSSPQSLKCVSSSQLLPLFFPPRVLKSNPFPLSFFAF